MSKHIIGCLLLVIMLAFATQAESNYWYYNYDGTAINMDVFDNLVAVRVDPNLPDWNVEHFAIDRGFLIDTFTVESAPGDFFLYGIEPGYSLYYAMTLLCLDESVLMVNPVVRDRYGDRAKLDNSLSVIYKSTTTPAQIDSLQQAWQLTVREVLDDSAFQIYFLDYNQRTSYDITILARQYYESGLCLVVEPNLTMKGRYNSDDAYYSEQWSLKNTGQHGGTHHKDELFKMTITIPRWKKQHPQFLRVYENDVDSELTAVCQVVRAAKLPDGTYEVGARFINIYEDDRIGLQRFIETEAQRLGMTAE